MKSHKCQLTVVMLIDWSANYVTVDRKYWPAFSLPPCNLLDPERKDNTILGSFTFHVQLMSLNLDTETVFCYCACSFDEWWHLFAADTKYFFLWRAMIYVQSFHTCIFPKFWWWYTRFVKNWPTSQIVGFNMSMHNDSYGVNDILKDRWIDLSLCNSHSFRYQYVGIVSFK